MGEDILVSVKLWESRVFFVLEVTSILEWMVNLQWVVAAIRISFYDDINYKLTGWSCLPAATHLTAARGQS